MVRIIPDILMTLIKEYLKHKRGIIKCYTSTRLPVNVVFIQQFVSRYEALVAERKIKQWTRKKKTL